MFDPTRNPGNPSQNPFLFVFSAVIVLAGIEFGGTTYACAAPASGSTRASAAVVPFTSTQPGQIIVPLYIDEAGPLQFLIDTGSSRSAIGETVAAKLALPLVAQTELVTASGSAMRPVVRLTNLRVGRARAQALLAPTLSDESVRRLGPGVAGVLGQDFLSRFNYTIDYRHDRLIWHDEETAGDEPGCGADQRGQGQGQGQSRRQQQGQGLGQGQGQFERQQQQEQGQGQGQGKGLGLGLGLEQQQGQETRRVRLTLRESEGRFLVDLPQDAGEQAQAPVSLVPDSAADGMVLFSRPSTNRLLADTSAERGQLVTLGGDRAGRLVVLKRLLIGAAAIFNQPAIVLIDDTDRHPDPDAPEGDGLLPLSMFARVTFNNRDGYLLLEPR